MRRNHAVALLLVFCLVVGVFGQMGAENEAPQSFPDVPADAWYAEAVAAMKDSSIIMGCDDGLFHPERLVTQGEFYAMLLRAQTFKGANISGGRKGEGDHWAAGVLSLADKGLGPAPNAVSYNENGEVTLVGHEDDPVSRTEAVTRVVAIYWDVLDVEDGQFIWTVQKHMPGEPMTFNDIPDNIEISSYLASEQWRQDAWVRYMFSDGAPDTIAYAYNQGICKGVDGTGTFNPTGLLTRAEVAQLFSNAGITKRLNIAPTKRWGMKALEYDLHSTENVVY